MNATKWKSLTEFAKYLGQEGLCRVDDVEDKGLHIAWIDNSPEALRRQAAVQKQERMERNDEEWEQRLMRKQIKRAEEEARASGQQEEEQQRKDFERKEGEKVTFSFGSKQKPAKPPTPPGSDGRSSSEGADKVDSTSTTEPATAPDRNQQEASAPAKAPIKMSLGGGASTTQKPRPRSMAALFGGKKAGAQGSKRPADSEEPKKMSEAERTMREDMERNKGGRLNGVGFGPKRVKLG